MEQVLAWHLCHVLPKLVCFSADDAVLVFPMQLQHISTVRMHEFCGRLIVLCVMRWSKHLVRKEVQLMRVEKQKGGFGGGGRGHVEGQTKSSGQHTTLLYLLLRRVPIALSDAGGGSEGFDSDSCTDLARASLRSASSSPLPRAVIPMACARNWAMFISISCIDMALMFPPLCSNCSIACCGREDGFVRKE